MPTLRLSVLVLLLGVSGCSLRPIGGDVSRNVAPAAVPADPSATELAAVRVNGVELHYDLHGDGEPIVFVHGGLVDQREWEPVSEHLRGHYRTITYSRRYNFPNRNTFSGTDHSAAVEGEDLAALIRQVASGPVHLAGISYGAYSALYTALRYPELVRSLTLVEPALVHWALDHPLGADLYRDFMSMWRASESAFTRGDSVAALTHAVDWFVTPGVFDQIPEEFRANLMSNIGEWQALTTSADAFAVVSRADVQSLALPALMISGGSSKPLFQLLDDEVEQHLRDVRRVIVPDGTHDVCSEQPRKCAELIRAFLEEQ
jgi:non-heme chloroperoxidase